MATTRDDWSASAYAGNVAKLQELIRKAQIKPDGPKAQEAGVTAASANQVQALETLLEWGVPVEAKNTEGRRAIAVACEAGAASTVALLIRRRASIDKFDTSGATCMQLAIKVRSMAVVKELLRAGAPLPRGEAISGLAAAVHEVHLERITEQLEQKSHDPEVSAAELQEIDGQVWHYQREHMRLLGLREEQRAGRQLISFKERRQEELEAAEKSRAQEGIHAALVTERRVELQALKLDMTAAMKELQGNEGVLLQLVSEDDKLKAEIKMWRDKVAQATVAVDTFAGGAKVAQDRYNAANKKVTGLELQISDQRKFNEAHEAALAAARKELEEWLKDREAAADLTAQAHKLLGN